MVLAQSLACKNIGTGTMMERLATVKHCRWSAKLRWAALRRGGDALQIR